MANHLLKREANPSKFLKIRHSWMM